MLDNCFINLSDLDKNDFGNQRLALSLFFAVLCEVGLVLEFSATFVGFQCGCVLCLHLAYSLFSGFDVNPLYGEKGKQCF